MFVKHFPNNYQTYINVYITVVKISYYCFLRQENNKFMVNLFKGHPAGRIQTYN